MKKPTINNEFLFRYLLVNLGIETPNPHIIKGWKRDEDLLNKLYSVNWVLLNLSLTIL